MLRDFIAIDFETANQEPSSVCSVGVVMVRDGKIVDSFYSLIQPEPNYYNYWCQRVHGIWKQMPELSIFSSEIIDKRNWAQPLIIKEVTPNLLIFRAF